MDVLLRSVQQNLTLSAKYERDIRNYRFTGYLNYQMLILPSFSEAAASWFEGITIGVLYFCDCDSKSQERILKAWVTPFDESVWLHLVITFLILSLTVAVKLRFYNGFTKSRVNDFFLSFITVAGIYLRQEGAIVGSPRLLLLTSFCIGVIISLYENTVTSELVVPPPKYEHNLSSLLMAAGAKVIYSGAEPAMNADLIELQTETQKWNIKYSENQLELNNKLHDEYLPLKNRTRLSYFGFYSAVERDLRFRKTKLINNKCHCYIVQHEFRQIEGCFVFKLFLRNRFTSTLNILRENGIVSFFLQNHRKYTNNRFLTKLRQRLKDTNYHSDFFVREELSIELIQLANLYFIIVIFGVNAILAVNIFAWNQMDWLGLFVYCKGLVSKHSMCKLR
jgi:hypothetical protein